MMMKTKYFFVLIAAFVMGTQVMNAQKPESGKRPGHKRMTLEQMVDMQAGKIVSDLGLDDKTAAKAKGSRGKNVRLTARLISAPNDRWDVRVEAYDRMTQTKSIASEGANELADILEISHDLAEQMIACGFTTVQGIASHAQPEDLVDALGISENEAFAIVDKAKNA